MRLRGQVPGLHYRKRCKPHGENGMAELATINAVGHHAIRVKRLPIIDEGAPLTLERLKHCGTSSTNRRASSRIAHWLAAFRGALSAPRQRAVCGGVVVHAGVVSSRLRVGYP